jgi:UDP-2-acetamido-3-amino-2,3-dideoxy-glucuronate N-acetyltransferase
MDSDVFVHPTADVEDGARVGAGTKVWHLAHIRSSAIVGDDCVIGRNVFVDAHAVVGSRVKIQNNVSVYHGVTLQDEVFVGPCAVFTNDFRPRAQNPDWEITPTLVKKGASIGANATLVCGIEVGEYAMIAAGSVVTKNVEPYQLVAGNPARPKGWVDEKGNVVSREPAQRPSV